MTVQETINDFSADWHSYFNECCEKYQFRAEDEQLILNFCIELIVYNYVIAKTNH